MAAKRPDFELFSVVSAPQGSGGKDKYVKFGALYKTQVRGTLSGEVQCIPIAFFNGETCRIMVRPVQQRNKPDDK
jgi:hypothetical protein